MQCYSPTNCMMTHSIYSISDVDMLVSPSELRVSDTCCLLGVGRIGLIRLIGSPTQ